ncbi:MAG: Cytochrome bd-I ubiquinol oxidase subunit 2 [Holosporales bacterium]
MESLPIPLDYFTLKAMWWLLLGVLVIGFCMMQGFDLGVCILLPFLGKTDEEKRILINTVGPFWEGSQVWLIIGGGAAFAAWPYLYAVAFSGLYLVLFLVLFSVIMRPVSFKFRSKMPSPTWRAVWDMGLFIGGFVPTLLMGVGIGNFLQNGFSFQFDDMLRLSFDGSFFDLLTPYTLAWGAFMVAMIVRHGACYLAYKTVDPIAGRLDRVIKLSNAIALVLGVVLVYKALFMGFYFDRSMPFTDGPANPLLKDFSIIKAGSWMHNMAQEGGLLSRFTFLLSLPILLIVTFLASFMLPRKALFWVSSLNFVGLIGTFGLMTYPFVLPSKHLGHSLTVYDAASSKLTLFIMVIAVVIFLPIVLAYTIWCYRVLRGVITSSDIQQNEKDLY